MSAIALADQIVTAVVAHAEMCSPAECCGLLAIDDSGRVRFAYPLTNVEDSPMGFTVAPAEAHGAFLHAERMGWNIAGTFHSHPAGPDRLSGRDIDEAPGADWLHLLITPTGLRAYRVENRIPMEMDLV